MIVSAGATPKCSIAIKEAVRRGLFVRDLDIRQQQVEAVLEVMQGFASAGVGVGREMAENVSHGRLETKKSSSGSAPSSPARARP